MLLEWIRGKRGEERRGENFGELKVTINGPEKLGGN